MIRSGMMRLLTAAVVVGVLTALVPATAAVRRRPARPRRGAQWGWPTTPPRGQVVLFGGSGTAPLFGDTWTWDGTDWTQRAPRTRPSAAAAQGMAYDAARGQVVLFGGATASGYLGDTWTWDGTDWTEQHTRALALRRDTDWGWRTTPPAARSCCSAAATAPATTSATPGPGTARTGPSAHPATRPRRDTAGDGIRRRPRARSCCSAGPPAYSRRHLDLGRHGLDAQHPAHSPSAANGHGHGLRRRPRPGRAVRRLRRQRPYLGDTWTWDGTDWTQRHPAHSPPGRDSMGMAYDAARGQVVLFGGVRRPFYLGDTWTWDGTDWSLSTAGLISLTPRSGPPGTVVQVQGSGFAAVERVRLRFFDSTKGRIFLRRVKADAAGGFSTQLTIPLGATPGRQYVTATGRSSGAIAKKSFTVT